METKTAATTRSVRLLRLVALLVLVVPTLVWLPTKPAAAVTPLGDGQVELVEHFQASVGTLQNVATSHYFTGTSGGHPWFAAPPTDTCTPAASPGLVDELILNGWTGTGETACGNFPGAAEVRQTATGMLLIPEGVTSLTVRASNAPVDGSERAAWFGFWAAAGPYVDDLVERGFGRTQLDVPLFFDFDVPIPTTCANPHAVAYRIYVYDTNTTYGYKLEWSLDGAAFVDIPSDAFSTIAGTSFVDANSNGIEDYKEEDFDGDGLTDWFEMGQSLDGINVDSDGDGDPDCADTDSDNDGNPDSTDPNRTEPIATNDFLNVVAGQTGSIADVLVNDDLFSYDPVTNPDVVVTDRNNGSADPADYTLNTDGSFTFTAPLDAENGSPYDVRYRACYTAATPNGCAKGRIWIYVSDEGDPAAVDDAVSTLDDQTPVDIDWADNDDLIDAATLDSIDDSATTGTVVDNGDGTFTYTPVARFQGDDTFDYTVCDDDPTPSCSTATVTVTVQADARIGIAKNLLVPGAPNPDGTFTIQYDLFVENLGNENLTAVTVTDPLPNFDPVSDITVTAPAGYTANPAYDGDGDTLVATPFDLAVNESVTLNIAITYLPTTPATRTNLAGVDATGAISSAIASDRSNDGTEPDPNDNDQAGDSGEDTPTVFSEVTDLPWNPTLTTTKTVVGSTAGSGGEFTTTYRIVTENTGNEPLDSVQISDPLSGFPNLSGAQITSVTGASANAGFDGTNDSELLDSAALPDLDLGDSVTVEFAVTYAPTTSAAITNTAAVTGDPTHGAATITDSADATINPAADLPLSRDITVAKQIIDRVDAGGGDFTITYRVDLAHDGTEPATVSLTDDLAAVFPAGFSATTTTSTGSINANTGFDGSGDTTLIDPVTLTPGDSGTVTYTVTYEPESTATITNTAAVAATGAISGITTPDQDSADLVFSTLGVVPRIQASKSVSAVADNGDGTFSLTWTVTLTNNGNEVLDPVGATDDLGSVLPAGYIVSGWTASGSLVANTSFDGAGDQNLLAPGSTLDVGATETVSFVTTFTPTAATGLTNNAAVTASGRASGAAVADSASATSAAIPIDPELTFALTASGPPSQVGDTVEYTFTITNTGNVAVSALTVTDDKCSATPVLQSGDTDSDEIVDVGETWVLTCTSVQVTQADADSGDFDNTATVTGTPAVGTLGPVDDTVELTIVADPSIAVTKAALNSPTSAGDTITYSITVINTGNVTISPVVITDLKCGTTPTLHSESGAADGDLVSGETQTWRCTSVAVTQAEIDAGQVDNTVTVSGTAAGGTLTPVSDDHTVTIVRAPAWTFIKSTTSAPTKAGDTLDYSFTLVNTGNVTIDDINITDPRCAAAPTLSGNPAEEILSVGETQIWTCTSLPVSQAQVDAGRVDNTATADGTTLSGSLPQASDSVSTPIPASPAWTVDKATDSVPTRVGHQLDYTFDVENTGNVSISAVSISDPKCESGPTLDSGDAGSDSVLGPGEVWHYICTSEPITLAEVDAGHVDNTVTVSGTPAQGSLDPITDTVVTPIIAQPSWQVVKSTGSGAAAAGDTLDYTFTLVNTGNVSISDVVVTDAKCATAVQLDSESQDDDQIIHPGETQIWSCTSVAVTQAQVDAGQVDNSVSVTGDPAGGNVDPATDDHTLTITQAPAWEIIKSALTSPSHAGDTIEYKFTVINTGNVTISGIEVVDPGCSHDPIALPGPLGPGNSLGPGLAEAWVCDSWPITQADVDHGQVLNTVTATGNPAGGSLDPATDDHVLNIGANPSWVVAKSALSGAQQADDTIDYEFDVTNTGNVTITNIAITDPKCATPAALHGGDDNANGALDVDETWIHICTSVPVTQAEVDAGHVDNTVEVTATAARGSLPLATDSVTSSIEAHPAWTVTKASLDIPEFEGDLLDYKFNVINTGNVTVTGVTVTDLKCDGAPTLIHESIHADTDLEAGETQIWTCTSIPVTQLEIDSGHVDNTVTVTGTAANGSLDPATADHIARVYEHPEIFLQMATTSVGSNAGDTLEYKFTVINTGNMTLTSPTVTDSKCDGAPTLLSESIVEDGILQHGETQVWRCESHPITQQDVDLGYVVDTATATGTPDHGPDVTDTAALTSPIIASPHWTMAKSALSAPSGAQDTILYHFDISNDGNITIHNVAVSDVKCDGSIYLFGGDDDADEELDVGETWIYECESIPVTQTEVDAGHVDNTATVSATPARGDLDPVTASLSIPLAAHPAISMIKSTDSVVGSAGNTIDYTFTLVNDGNVTITDPIIVDAKCAADPILVLETVTADGISTPGETQRWTCTSIPVTQAEVDAGHVDNTATATGTPRAGVLDPVTATHVLQVDAHAELAAIKSHRTEASWAGDTIEYAFTVINTGNVTAEPVNVEDPKCASAPTLESESHTTDGIISPGETKVWTCTSVPVTQAEVDAGLVENTAIVHATPAGGTLIDLYVSDTASVIPHPDWTFAKTAVGAVAAAGDTLAYEFEATNTGNVTILAVDLVDARCAAAPDLIAGDSDGDGRFDVGETWTWTCTSVPVTQAEVDAGEVVNVATLTGDPANGLLADATSTARVEIVAAPSFEAAKAAASPVAGAGDQAVYNITVVNTGNVTLSDVAVDDPKCSGPATIASESVSDDGLASPGEVQVWTCTSVPVTQAEVDAGEVVNVATVAAMGPGGPLAPIAVEHSTPINAAPNVTVTKTTPTDVARAGDALDYSITVVNDGNVTIDDGAVADPKCAADPTIGSESIAADGVLDAGETQVWTCTSIPVTQAEVDAGEVTNTATYSGNPRGGTLDQVTATVSTPVPAQPGWLVDKATSDVPTRAGETLEYRFDVVNTGNVTIADVVVADAKCATVATIDSESIAVDGVVSPGETQVWTCTSIPVTQAEVDAGVVTNSVTVTGSPTQGTLVPVTDEIETAGSPTSGLDLVKSFGSANDVNGDGAIAAGDTVTWTFELTNTGDVTLYDLVVSDDDAEVSGGPLAELAPGETDTTTFVATTVLTQADIDRGHVDNTASASGLAPTGESVDTGSRPPAGAGGEEPTRYTVEHFPAAIGVAMSVVSVEQALPANAAQADVSATVTFEIVVANLGAVTLTEVSVIDDLVTVFGGRPYSIAGLSAGGTCVANPGFDGASDTDMLSAASSLVAGAECDIVVQIVVEAEHRFVGSNQVTATALSPTGRVVSDLSTAGVDADPDGDGSADEDESTPIVILRPAQPDEALDQPADLPVEIEPFANDGDGIALGNLVLIVPATGQPTTELVVAGEGTWTVDQATNTVTFTPETGFSGQVTPVVYQADVGDLDRSLSATITVSIAEPEGGPWPWSDEADNAGDGDGAGVDDGAGESGPDGGSGAPASDGDGATTESTTEPLAYTGSRSGLLSAVALIMIGLGILQIVIARRLGGDLG